MDQTVISTGIEFTLLTVSAVPPESDHPNLSQIQEYNFFQVNNPAHTVRVDLNRRLGDEHYWNGSTKSLTRSDVNNQSRLLWPARVFRTTMRQYLVDQRITDEGLRVEVEDIDTGTRYMMTLKRWGSGSYVLKTYWKRNFVNRRNLKEGDVIGLVWDNTNCKFYFSVRERNNNYIMNE